MSSQHPTSFDLGHTHGVRQRRLRYLPALWAARTFDVAFEEALRRKELAAEGRLELVALDAATGPLFRSIGWDIEQLGAAMVAADVEAERARRRGRKARATREASRRSLYRELVKVRSIARDLLRKIDPDEPCLRGDTERDPHHLVAQTREVIAWATDEDCPLDALGLGLDGATLITRLRPRLAELRAALAAVVQAETELDVPLSKRQRAIRSFDREVPRACRVLESALAIVGLPTLAAAVRPHLKGTGRVGRPSHTPPVDEHPDLVANLQAADLVAAPRAASRNEATKPQKPRAKSTRVFGAFHASPGRRQRTSTTSRRRRRRVRRLSGWRLVQTRHPGALRRRRSLPALVAI